MLDEVLVFVVVFLDGLGEVCFVNVDWVMNLGFIMKLLIIYVVLELFGFSFKWYIRVYIDGELNGDVLEGNLFLVGVGDFKFIEECFW